MHKTISRKLAALAAAATLCCGTAQAYDFMVDSIYYTVSDAAAYVTYASSDYNSYSGDVVIPDSVTYEALTYPVSGIMSGAFMNSTGLTSVTVGQCVVDIGTQAFYGCTALTDVKLGDNVETIAEMAFGKCSQLTRIVLPDKVYALGKALFLSCSSLKSVNLPSGITIMNSQMFNGCSSIDSIFLPSGVTSLGAYFFYGCSSLKTITMSDNVTSLGQYCFAYCSSLEELTLSKGLTTITTQAFYNCTALKYIEIPSGVTTLGQYTFYGCSSLEEVKFPETFKSIGTAAFSGCGLKTLTLPNSVDSLALSVFANCTSLTHVTLSDSLKTLKSYDFDNDSSITYMYMGGVETLDYYSLRYSGSYDTIVFTGALQEIASYAFWGAKIRRIEIPSSVTSLGAAFTYCDSLEEVVVPASVPTLAQYAFRECGNLKTVTLKGNPELKVYAFRSCTSLTDIYCYTSEPPECHNLAFYGTTATSTATLHIPTDSRETYAAANVWCDFVNVEEFEVPTSETTYWLSGGINSWSTANDSTYSFTNNGDGTHTLALDEFYGEFKIITEGGDAWYGYGTIQLDTAYTITTSGGNISLPSATDTYTGVTFTLTDADDGSLMLKVSAQGQVSNDVVYYLVGDSPLEWAASDSYALTATGTGGVHAITLSSEGFTTSTGMKILTSTSLWLGYESYNIDYGTSYELTTSGNNFCLNTTPQTDALTFTLTANDGTYYLVVTDSGESGIDGIGEDGRTVIAEKFYTASGAQVTEPAGDSKAIYIVVKTYDDGTTEAVKEIR